MAEVQLTNENSKKLKLAFFTCPEIFPPKYEPVHKQDQKSVNVS